MLKIKNKKGKVKNRDSFRISIKSTAISKGFKVFIQRAAERRDIKGILNDKSYGISLNLEGDKDKIYDLVSKIYEDRPHSVVIESIDVDQIEYVGYDDFQIPEENVSISEKSLSLADIAICPDCIEEIFNPKGRRYLYPFISCSYCGPRLSLIKQLPYKRENTVMDRFELCPKCLKDIEDSSNRRFGNHINSCWDCGPKLSLKHRDSLGEYNYHGREALDKAIEFLNKGAVLVFKNISGYKVCSSLSYDAPSFTIEDSFKDIESYLMLKGMKMAESYVRTSEKERELLLSHRRPKVLLRFLEDVKIQDRIKRDKKYFKFKLPCSGLDYVIFKSIDVPLLIKDCGLLDLDEISNALKGVSWSLLSDDRDFSFCSQDSEVRVFTSRDGTLSKDIIIKRSKGYIPDPLTFEYQLSSSMLALGIAKKSSFTLAINDKFYLSLYLGDLSQDFNQLNYRKVLDSYIEMFKIEPKVIAIEEESSSYLNGLAEDLSKSFSAKVVKVNSDHARIISSVLEDNIYEDVIGIVFNNKLKDNNVFYLNFYLTNLSGSKIVGSFESLEGLLGINRDYDISSELSLEVKDEFCNDSYPIEIRDAGNRLVILSEPILDGVKADIKMAIPCSRIAAKLYNTIALGVYKMSLRIRKRLKINRVSLAGDIIENIFLLTNIHEKLKSKDFEIYIPGSIPVNDSGISLGQSIAADNIIKEETKSSSDS